MPMLGGNKCCTCNKIARCLQGLFISVENKKSRDFHGISACTYGSRKCQAIKQAHTVNLVFITV